MENTKKFVITIGREYGSGGRFIGKQLAKKLNIGFYDNELLAIASNASGLSPAVIENYDEKKDGFFTGMIPSSFGFDMSLGQKVFLAQFDTIKKIAQNESCVIVGRCADYVLRGNKDVVNIFICAPMKYKMEHVVKYYGIEKDKAHDTIIKIDKKRKNYYNFYSDCEWGKAYNYDLCINSEIGVDETVDTIISFVKAKLKIEV